FDPTLKTANRGKSSFATLSPKPGTALLPLVMRRPPIRNSNLRHGTIAPGKTRLIAGQRMPGKQVAHPSPAFGTATANSTITMKNAGFNSDKLKRMKTSHPKIAWTLGLAATCLIVCGQIVARAQDAGATNNNSPVYAPIDMSSNTAAATTVAQ